MADIIVVVPFSLMDAKQAYPDAGAAVGKSVWISMSPGDIQEKCKAETPELMVVDFGVLGNFSDFVFSSPDNCFMATIPTLAVIRGGITKDSLCRESNGLNIVGAFHFNRQLDKIFEAFFAAKQAGDGVATAEGFNKQVKILGL